MREIYICYISNGVDIDGWSKRGYSFIICRFGAATCKAERSDRKIKSNNARNVKESDRRGNTARLEVGNNSKMTHFVGLSTLRDRPLLLLLGIS